MKLGVLLINTGTADKPTEEAVANYLFEFLTDPVIIGAPYPIRKLIAGHVCALRPKRTVRHYRAFWTPEGSPFMLASMAQRDALEASLRSSLGQDVTVVLAMRYGNPSIARGLTQLRDAGCDTVVLLPSYPQEVKVCAGTCLKEAHSHLAILHANGWKPHVVEIHSFYEQPAYKQALAQSVTEAWTYQPGSKLVVSFHSTLLKDIEKGDPYEKQTKETAKTLAQNLGIPEEDLVVSYQSRFDNRSWLGPFTEQTVINLAEEGVKDICVICPIFTAENIETAIEVDRDLRNTFMVHAGPDAQFTYVHALNAAPGLIEGMDAAVREALEA